MLPSATIGGAVDLYEPVHGSAPEIAGKNIANPLGAIASVAMLLRYTAKNEQAALAVEDAIKAILNEGYRTIDIAETGCRMVVSTADMGTLVASRAIEHANVKYAYHAV